MPDPARPRILVVYFSQSGDVRRMAEAFAAPLEAAGAEITWAELRPTVEYPSPWRNVHRFFNVMPECVLGLPPPIEPLTFPANTPYDLVVLAYQVWFLAPSPPFQALMQSADAAALLRGRNVITISVSRNMWHQASIRMKKMLAASDANHLDNIVVTHQGPPWATFVTTTRTLLTGKRDRLWGVFPRSGIPREAETRLRRLGEAAAARLSEPPRRLDGPLLRGLDAVEVNQRYVIPEFVASRCFPIWAHVIRGLGRIWRPLRHVGIFLFFHFLMLMILLGVPLTIITLPIVYPFVRKPMSRYVSRLKQPTES